MQSLNMTLQKNEVFALIRQIVVVWNYLKNVTSCILMVKRIIHEIIKNSANIFVRYAALSYWYRRRCALKLKINELFKMNRFTS